MEAQKKDVVEALISNVGQLTGLIKVHKEDMGYVKTCKCGYYAPNSYQICAGCKQKKCALCFNEKMYVIHYQMKGRPEAIDKCCSLECLDLTFSRQGFFIQGNSPNTFSNYFKKIRPFVVPPKFKKKVKN